MIDYIFYGVTLTLFMVIAYIVNTFCLELKRLKKENKELAKELIEIKERIDILRKNQDNLYNVSLYLTNEVEKIEDYENEKETK